MLETTDKISKKIRMDAKRIMAYDPRSKVGGGFELKHSPSSYGIILKYFFEFRGFTYRKVAELLNTTAQNINDIVNRRTKDRISSIEIYKFCKLLKVNEEYFYKLSNEIDKVLEKN
jgi:plasmid maintenance system antidote protein VapI